MNLTEIAEMVRAALGDRLGGRPLVYRETGVVVATDASGRVIYTTTVVGPLCGGAHVFDQSVFESSVVTGGPLRRDCVCGARGPSEPAAALQTYFRAITPPGMKWEPFGENGLVAGWRLVRLLLGHRWGRLTDRFTRYCGRCGGWRDAREPSSFHRLRCWLTGRNHMDALAREFVACFPEACPYCAYSRAVALEGIELPIGPHLCKEAGRSEAWWKDYFGRERR